MAKHDISLNIVHGITVVNTDVEVEVRADDELLGRIGISRGSIDWKPAHKQSVYRLRWESFARLMEEHVRASR